MENLECLICKKEFLDLGNHPATCGSLRCTTEAGKRGWWEICLKAYEPLNKRPQAKLNLDFGTISLQLREKLANKY